MLPHKIPTLRAQGRFLFRPNQRFARFRAEDGIYPVLKARQNSLRVGCPRKSFGYAFSFGCCHFVVMGRDIRFGIDWGAVE